MHSEDSFLCSNAKIAPDQYLYHFTNTEKALNILQKKELWFNPLIYVNDPRESKDWGFSMINLELDHKETSAMLKEIKMQTRLYSKVLCFTADQPFDGPDIARPFSRGFGHPSLWAHYADNHKGVCLVFDKAALSKALSATLKGTYYYEDHVLYTNFDKEEGNSFTISPELFAKFNHDIPRIVRAYIHHSHKTLFFSKAEDWKSESEYRWVVIDDDERLRTVSIINAIRAIIYGADFRGQNRFRSCCKDFDVKFGQICWDRGCIGVSEIVYGR